MHFSKKPKVFYGYWVMASAFFCVFIYSGCGFYAFSLFVTPLQADLSWDRGEIMIGWTIFALGLAVVSPLIGRLVDRYGARRVIAIGAATGGLGFVWLSQMNDLWHFYVGYIIIAGGISASGIVPATTVVINWFEKRRGTAIGIMATGVGVGGFALGPLLGYLIPNFDWRVSYLVLAVLTWILIPLALFVIRTRPADMGLYPDGTEVPEAVAFTEASLPATEGLSLKMALATSGFWLIAVSFLTSSFISIGIIQHQVAYLQDVGFPLAIAATAVAGVGLGSAIGKFGFGWLCDRIQAKYAYAIALVLQLVGIIILMSVGPGSPPAIVWLYSLVFGLGAGGWLPSMSILVSTNFGLVSYGTIFGMVTLAQSLGLATGPLMAGYMYDAMGTYHWAFIIFMALYTVAVPAVLAVRRPKSP